MKSLILIQFCISLILCVCFGYDLSVANTSIALCQISYCKPESSFVVEDGHAQGFHATSFVHQKDLDLYAMLGYRYVDNTIYVVYMGTKSGRTLIVDFFSKMVSYPPCNDCKVHEGFYIAHELLIGDIVSAVRKTQILYPSATIVVTGHSLGAAIATLTAVTLSHQERIPCLLYNFGSPLLFNDKGAEYASTLLKGWINRFTHYKDPFVHVPQYSFEWNPKRYQHTDGEVYEHPTLHLTECEGHADPHCAAQWDLWSDTNIYDHMVYLGLAMVCDDKNIQYV